jgi:antitoxin MazE
MTVLSLWGNSAALRIPAIKLKEANLAMGQEVEVRAERGRLIIEPATPAYDLDAMVAAINPENCHAFSSHAQEVGAERIEW